MRIVDLPVGRRGSRGVALLSIIIVLLFLSFLALVFAVLVSAERRVSRRAALAVRARLLARSGLEYAAARLNRDPAPVPRASWTAANAPDDWTCRDGLSVSLRDLMNPSYRLGETWSDANGNGIWETGEYLIAGGDQDDDGSIRAYSSRLRGSLNPISDIFKLRVADAGGFLHLNMGRLDTADTNGNGVPDHRDPDHPTHRPLVLMLDNLGAIRGVASTTDTGLPTETSTLGNTIVSNRPAGGWGTVGAIRGLLSQADFDAVRDFLTVAAWEDATAIRVWTNGYLWGESYYGDGLPMWEVEPRAPLALNAAPAEAIEALLRHLRVVGMTRNGDTMIEGVVWDAGVGGYMPGDPHEASDAAAYPGMVVVQPDEAAALAAAIVATRAEAEESFTDGNANGVRDTGEAYTDANGNGVYDFGTFETWREFFAFLNDRKGFFDDGGFGTAEEIATHRNLHVDLIHANTRPDFALFWEGNRSWYTLEVERDGGVYGWDTACPRRVSKMHLERRDDVSGTIFQARTTEFRLGRSDFFRVESWGEVARGYGTYEATAEAIGTLRAGDGLRVTSQEDFENLTAEASPKGTGADRVRDDGLRVEGRPLDRTGIQTYPKFSQDSYSPDALDPSDAAHNVAIRDYYGYAGWSGSVRLAKRTARYGGERFLLPWNDDTDQVDPVADPLELIEHLTCEVTGSDESLDQRGYHKFTWGCSDPNHNHYIVSKLFPSGRTLTDHHGSVGWTPNPFDDGTGIVSAGTIEFWIAADSERGHWGEGTIEIDNTIRFDARVVEEEIRAQFDVTEVTVAWPAPAPSVRAWRHVAIRFGTDPGDGVDKFQVFVDGAIVPGTEIPFAAFASAASAEYRNWRDVSDILYVKGIPPRWQLIDDVRGFDVRLDDATIAAHAAEDVYATTGTYVSPRYHFADVTEVRSASWEGYVPREILAGGGGLTVSLLLYDAAGVLTAEIPLSTDGSAAGVGMEAVSFRIQAVFDGGTVVPLQDTPVLESVELRIDRPLTAGGSGGADWISWEERTLPSGGALPPPEPASGP